MAYDIVSKFIKNSPLPCWKGYRRKAGTTEFSKGSCEKIPSSNKMLSPVKEYVSDEQAIETAASNGDTTEYVKSFFIDLVSKNLDINFNLYTKSPIKLNLSNLRVVKV